MKQLQRHFNSVWLKFSFDMLFRLARDPWQYSSAYEQWKYQQELQLLPATPILQALELGCAEGIFTVQLAARVGHLVAADISPIALERATQRCLLQHCENVRVIQFDLTQDELPAEQFDFIICSEILYYMGDQSILQEVAKKLARSLKPDGYLLTSNDYRVEAGNSNLRSVQPSETFKKSRIFGAEVIGAALSETSLQLVKVIQTPFYCTHLFQRSLSNTATRSPEVVNLTRAEVPQPKITLFDWFSIAVIVRAWRQRFKIS